MPEEELENDNLNEENPQKSHLSEGVKLAKDVYQAKKNYDKAKGDNPNADKVKMGAQAVANHFAGPAGGAAVEALSKTKAGKAALNAGGELISKIPGMANSKKKNDDEKNKNLNPSNNKNGKEEPTASPNNEAAKQEKEKGAAEQKENKLTKASEGAAEAASSAIKLTAILHTNKVKIIAIGVVLIIAVIVLLFVGIIVALDSFDPFLGTDDRDNIPSEVNTSIFNADQSMAQMFSNNDDERQIYEYIVEVAEEYGEKSLVMRRSIAAIYSVIRDHEEHFTEASITKSDIKKMARMVNKSLGAKIPKEYDEDDDDDTNSDSAVSQYEIDEEYLAKKLVKYFKSKDKTITDHEAQTMAKEAVQYIEDYKSLIGEKDNNSCDTYASSADTSSGRMVRTTHYEYCKNGTDCAVSSIGGLEQYFKTGQVYYDNNNYVMIKGGTAGYGETGKNYLIVATAHRALIGKFGYTENSLIKYYEHGDTFSLKFDSSDVYNAIVLDQCGACMSFSTTSNDPHSPSKHPNSSTDGMEAARKTNNTKIDVMINKSGANVPDFATMMDGTTGSTCVGQIDLGELVVGLEDTQLLQGTSMQQLYGEQGISELNNLIISNVDKYGRKTGKGVAAAAITLINSLKQKGYRLPYYWAGGHEDHPIGVKSSWGSSTYSSCSSSRCYTYSSLDCSGFVSWAIRNGGCSSFTSDVTSGFNSSSYGPIISSSEAKPGDILVKNGHILLVVQNNGNDVILAESSGGSSGVHYTSYNNYGSKGSYVFRDMTGFYNSCN